MATRGEIEKWALEDYGRVLGKVILVSELSGYRNDISVDFNLDPPAKVRVVKTPEMDLYHWNDEWLDPYWDLELVAPHPRLDEVRGLYMFGDSYSLDGKYQPARYEPREGPRSWSPRDSSGRKKKR